MFRIINGPKRLNPFFKINETSEVFNKYVMGVWSGNFTAAFFVSFIMTVFAPDIVGIESKVANVLLNWNNFFSECNERV